MRLLGDGVAIAGDHADEADAQRMVDETVAAFGRLDVLVNNAAAIRRNVPVHELTAERWDEQLTVNLRGPFLVARAALRAMLDGSGDRAIVNVSSTLAHKAAPGVAPYSAAKAGLLALTRSIAIEYGERGIRCNAVCPRHRGDAARRDRPAELAGDARAAARALPAAAASASRTTSRAPSPTWPRPRPRGSAASPSTSPAATPRSDGRGPPPRRQAWPLVWADQERRRRRPRRAALGLERHRHRAGAVEGVGRQLDDVGALAREAERARRAAVVRDAPDLVRAVGRRVAERRDQHRRLALGQDDRGAAGRRPTR